jgi:hypothetical protein
VNVYTVITEFVFMKFQPEGIPATEVHHDTPNSSPTITMMKRCVNQPASFAHSSLYCSECMDRKHPSQMDQFYPQTCHLSTETLPSTPVVRNINKSHTNAYITCTYHISQPIRCTFFTEKCDLNLTCVLCAEGKYYFQTYKYPYSY